MEGWVSLHRKIMDHWTYQEKRTFSKFEAWIDLILHANHKDTRFPLGNELIEAKRGEVITSEIKLMERWGWSKSKTRSFLELLEKDQMIVKKTDRKKTTITICNYSVFQEMQIEKRPPTDREQTANRPRADTINNENNVNNENNLKTLPTIADEFDLITEDFTPKTKSKSDCDNIASWLKKYEINCKGVWEKEDIESFIGVVDMEVIEAAIKKAGGKSVPYAVSIIKDWVEEGKTTKDSLKPVRSSRNILTYQRGTKPQLAIVSVDREDSPIPGEELNELLKLARKLDGKEVTA